MSPEERVEQLVRNSAPALLGFLLRRCPIPADAADLLSEVYVVLWRRRAELPESEGQARAYAFGVARGVLANEARGRRRRSALVERLRSEVPRTVPPPDVDAIVLRAALEDLEPAQRQILLMAGVHDLATEEIADMLGLTTAAVRQRLRRARGRLRAGLADDVERSSCAAGSG